MRQVPDHQEVFVHKNSESLIIELLQYDEAISDDKVALQYFEAGCYRNLPGVYGVKLKALKRGSLISLYAQ